MSHICNFYRAYNLANIIPALLQGSWVDLKLELYQLPGVAQPYITIQGNDFMEAE